MELLNPKEMYSFSMVSRDAYVVVMEYLEMRFSMMVLLLRYFGTRKNALQFWALMATTDLLISGSSAVQFFSRTLFPTSDLDLYVEDRHALNIATWLISVGYTYMPRTIAASSMSLEEVVEFFGRHTPATRDRIMPLTNHGYSGATMVLDFLNPATSKRIQLVTVEACPLQLILRFHSSELESQLYGCGIFCRMLTTIPTPPIQLLW